MNEFCKYMNYTYVDLGIGHFCLELKRFVKNRSFSEQIDRLEENYDSVEQAVTDSINLGDIEKLEESNRLEHSLDSITARMNLYCLYPHPERN